MWYPATITTPAAGEPVSDAEAKAHLVVIDDDDATLVTRLVKAARTHTEKYCGVRLAEQTISVACDRFADMCRFPEAPMKSVTSIKYIDTDGIEQTLPTSVYQPRPDGLEPSISLKYNQSWPATQPKSRITVEAIVGYEAAPEDVKHAMLLLIGHFYANREAVNVGTIVTTVPLGFDSLLVNDRRNA
jgi:uncharacterized phiE125 gp8 family phage protein